MQIHLSPPLDKYVVQRIIGTGAFADVCLAVEKKGPGTRVAIKIMFDKKDKKYAFYAAQEIAILKLLKHDNIIKVIGYCFKKRCIAFVMPFVPLGSLKQHIKSHGPMVREEYKVKQIMQQLCDALVYMHSIHVMHGDIKSSNILIEHIFSNGKFTKDDSIGIKLCDFGLALVVMEELNENHLTGTLDYMAPEKIMKQPYDHTSDLYSAGILMYECLFGTVPFKGGLEYHMNILKNNIPCDLPTCAQTLSNECIRLLNSLIHYDRKKRLKGKKLLKHEFLKVEPKVYQGENYEYARNMIELCQELEKKKEFGSSYVTYREAIINLEVYYVTCADESIRVYVKSRIEDYKKWSKHLEDAITSQEISCDFGKLTNYDFQYSQLKQICSSTQDLLVGLELAYMGDMYAREKFYQCAETYLLDGVGKLLAALEKEPPGVRKNILGAKVKEWLDLIETIRQHIKYGEEKEYHEDVHLL